MDRRSFNMCMGMCVDLCIDTCMVLCGVYMHVCMHVHRIDAAFLILRESQALISKVYVWTCAETCAETCL